MENESRKEFSNAERADYMRRLMRIEQAKAKESMSAGGGSGDSGRQKSDNPIRADEEVARQFDISRDTLRMENPMQKSAQGTSRDIVSKQFGISHDTMKKELEIVEHKDIIPPEDYAEWELEQLTEVQIKKLRNGITRSLINRQKPKEEKK